MKSLVVYYSLTGKTRVVAQAIAEALSATVMEITETKTRRVGPLIYLIGGFGAITNRASKINPLDIDCRQYEAIFVGSPIWASRPVPAVNSFIYQTDFEGRKVIPFFSMGGKTSEKALANVTAKIEKRQGKVAGSFAVTSYGVSDEKMIASTKGAIEKYSN
jgi:flavodoxin